MNKTELISFLPISPNDLPEIVAKNMLARTKLYVLANEQDSNVGMFNGVHAITYENGNLGYIAEHDKVYLNDDKESNTYLYDIDTSGDIVGMGEIRYEKNSAKRYFTDKPFVGWTETSTGFEKQGYGRRRLLAMNMASLMLHGLSLHSGTIFTNPAVPVIWDRLVVEGLAEKYQEPIGPREKPLTTDRYKFL